MYDSGLLVIAPVDLLFLNQAQEEPSIEAACTCCKRPLKEKVPFSFTYICLDCASGETYGKFLDSNRRLKQDLSILQNHHAVILEEAINAGVPESKLKELGVTIQDAT